MEQRLRRLEARMGDFAQMLLCPGSGLDSALSLSLFLSVSLSLSSSSRPTGKTNSVMLPCLGSKQESWEQRLGHLPSSRILDKPGMKVQVSLKIADLSLGGCLRAVSSTPCRMLLPRLSIGGDELGKVTEGSALRVWLTLGRL